MIRFVSGVCFRRIELVLMGLVRELKKERPVRVDAVWPVHGVTGKQVGHIRAVRIFHLFSVHVQSRVIILSLPLEAHPAVETRLRLVVLIAHVPFANESRQIVCRLEVLRETTKPPWHGGTEEHTSDLQSLLPPLYN